MWNLKFLCLVLIIGVMSSDAVKRARRTRKRQTGGYAGSSAGSSANSNGYNGGYVGGYAGNDDYGTGSYFGTGFDYAPDFNAGFIDPYLFHQQLTAQILAQHAAQQNALASSTTTGNANACAFASTLPDDIHIQNQIANQAYYGNKPHRYAPNFAAASGSIGPGGYHQTAYISPANPSSPNINSRFSPSSPGGFKGVSVSSYSSSSDVNGKRTSQRGAQTTVNDNGKVSTYSVHS